MGRILATLIAVALLAAEAQATYILDPAFSRETFDSTDVVPNFRWFDHPAGGGVVGFGGGAVTIPFDGGPATTEFTSLPSVNHDYQRLRVHPVTGEPHFLFSSFSVTGRMDVLSGGTQSLLFEFNPLHRFPRGFDFDTSGNIYAMGTTISLGDPGWVAKYTDAGALIWDVDVPQDIVAIAMDGDQPYVVTQDEGAVYSVDTATGALSLVTTLADGWVGFGVGVVESFTVGPSGNFFLGINRGTLGNSGENRAAVLRLRQSGATGLLALGNGERTFDLNFDGSGRLFIPNLDTTPAAPEGLLGLSAFLASGSSPLTVVSGNFDGEFAGILGLPEPGTGLLVCLGLFLLNCRSGNQAKRQGVVR